MSAKHTPGPWRIEGYTRLIGGEVTGHTISHGVNNYRDGPEGYVCTTNGTSEADALLIAAAPDLLEALKPFAIEAALWDNLPNPPPENEKLWVGARANRYSTDEARFSLADLRRARAALAKATGAPQ